MKKAKLSVHDQSKNINGEETNLALFRLSVVPFNDDEVSTICGAQRKMKKAVKTHYIKGTKVQNLFLPSGSFFLSLSTYHGTFYFLFNLMDPWTGGNSQGKCRSSQMLKNLITQLSSSKIHQLQGSTSCRLLDPYTVPQLEVGKSILLSHDKWVTPNQPQLPGRDIPQYLD